MSHYGNYKPNWGSVMESWIKEHAHLVRTEHCYTGRPYWIATINVGKVPVISLAESKDSAISKLMANILCNPKFQPVVEAELAKINNAPEIKIECKIENGKPLFRVNGGEWLPHIPGAIDHNVNLNLTDVNHITVKFPIKFVASKSYCQTCMGSGIVSAVTCPNCKGTGTL